MLGDPDHRSTGNKLVIVIEGFCENPDLECDLDYWKYTVSSYFPCRNDSPLHEASGYLYADKEFKDLGTWWTVLTERLIKTFRRGG